MNQDHHIKLCENYIAKLEECRRTGTDDHSQLNEDIKKAYEQLALLKIRQSMDLAI